MNDIGGIVVVGAVNIDISGTSNEQLVLYDSNPGSSHISFGGVGRNIADNLCRLGEKVEMITVLGDDIYSKELVNASEAFGISFKHSMHIDGCNCSTYICINNNDGDMSLAVSDMTIYDKMTVDFIKSKMEVLNNSRLVILDTNIPQDIIEYIARNCTTPISADPVSTKKAVKLMNILDRLHVIKPNIFETEIITGIKIDDNEDVITAAKYLINKGVKNVFLSMGSEGVYYTNGTECGICPILPDKIVNTTGCGDAFVAAVSWAMLNGYSLSDMAKAGVSAASVCARAEDTISRDLSVKFIRECLESFPKNK